MCVSDHMNARPCRSCGWISLLLTNWSWLWYSISESIPFSSRLTLDTDWMEEGGGRGGGGEKGVQGKEGEEREREREGGRD